jgi:hypothetical protein
MVNARTWVAGAVVAALALGATAGAHEHRNTGTQEATQEGRTAGFVNTVWVVVSSTAVTPGALYVFLSTKVLVISSEGNTPSFGTWASSGAGLIMTEEGRSYPVAILESTRERFRIRIDNPGTPTEITFAPAGPDIGPGDPGPGSITPMPTTYVCGTSTFKVAFEAGMAYVTMPDGTALKLPRLGDSASTQPNRTYTNGRITVIEHRDGSGPPVTMARGRMVPTPCTKAP